MATSPALVRPRTGRVIAGVCIAVANRFGFDPTLVRVGTVVLGLFSGLGLILYIVLWIVVPEES